MSYGRRIAVLVALIGSLLLFVVFLFAGFLLFRNPGSHTVAEAISYSQLLDDVDAGRVHDIAINGSEIQGTFNDGHKFQTYAPTDPALIRRLYDRGVSIRTQPE